MKPTEEETEAEYQKLADSYGMPLESVKNLVTVEGINGDIQNQKAIDFIRENAVIQEAKDEEKAEEKPAPKKRASRKKAKTEEEKPEEVAEEKSEG